MKRILITGITGNLGHAAEKHFSEAGWETVGAARRYGIDLSNKRVMQRWITKLDPFDIVLMAHGTQETAMVGEYNERNWHVIDSNLTSSVYLSNTLAKDRKLKPGALIVYCSSIQATQPRAGRGLYAIAKAGLEALARIMAVELAPDARAIALRLGQMEGQMAGMIFPESEKQKIADKIPLPWVGFDDTARLVMTLYEQPSLSGEVIEISSLHKYSVWPD